MLKSILASTAVVALLALTPAQAADVSKAPPAAPFQKVSDLVKLPDFVPGLGQLFVDPSTLPAGPFLAYDHDGKLVSTVYMVPLADLDAHKSFDNLKAYGPVDHTDIYYNAGHPGVEVPHYHIVLWAVPEAEADKLK
jgi:hypothetical protein